MPFIKKTVMEQKQEFIALLDKGLTMTELCLRFSISRKTGYKWKKRYLDEGVLGLRDRSRRPKESPNKTSQRIEELVVILRKNDPDWGGKKIHKILERDYGHKNLPSVTTINNILKRNGLINPINSEKSKNFQSFEYELPNQLWQMDFKGDFMMLNQKRCFPLTIIDDHSRYNICLDALPNQQYSSVQKHLKVVFKKYGRPQTILCDNGNPWGMSGLKKDEGRLTKLEKWLMKIDIRMIHGRAYHPQTQGKLERYHRTLKLELLSKNRFKNIPHSQLYFKEWKNKYNHYRPHESLDLNVPAKRYVPSQRSYTDILLKPEYLDSDTKRKVDKRGLISFKGNSIRVGKALGGEYVAVRPKNKREYAIYFMWKEIKTIHL